jgi:acyl-CoA synthetase (NDP forming)
LDRATAERLDVIFAPETVAMVGASDAHHKWGFHVFSALREFYGHKRIYAVNPSATTVHGQRSYPSVRDIPDPVDVAVITVPAAQTIAVMRDCVAKGVKSAIIISGGFAETGEAGAALQDELVRLAREGGVRIVGPNVMGHFSTASGINTTPFVRELCKGPLALAAQSGNVGVQIVQHGTTERIGFSKFVGVGNEADLTVEDYLEYFGQDPESEVITLYIEGLRHGRRFFESCRGITRRKPVIVIKGGCTDVGARAARSHSSALAGSDAVYSAMFRQCGAIRTDTISDLLYTAASLSRLPLPRTRKVALLTVGRWTRCHGGGSLPQGGVRHSPPGTGDGRAPRCTAPALLVAHQPG